MLQKIQSQIMKHKLLVVIGLLIFIVAMSSKVAMHSTMLGKSILVALVVALAYLHKVAGLVAVIFLIILYQSQSGAFYYSSPYNEGFAVTDASGNTKTVTIKGDGLSAGADGLKFDISGNLDILPPPSSSAQTTPPASGQGQEGFDLLGTEDTMRKGKQSNSVNVKKNTNQTGSLLPFENAKYVENFLVL